MNRYITSLLFLLIVSTSAFAGNLKAYFTYCTFDSPTDGPYIETYLSIIGNSVIHTKNESGTYNGTIQVTYIFKKGDEIITFKKYNLLSPEIKDSLSIRDNFVDQQRISLPNGEYEFEITIEDVSSSSPPFKSMQILNIDFKKNEIQTSDIELIESLKKTKTKSIISKSGYDILPYTSDFYPESFNKIAFYTEIYNTDKVLGENESYLITYAIESYETNKVIGNYKGFIRETTKPVNVVLKSFDIKNLNSGNYNLTIEARDKNNEVLITKKIFFQRSSSKSTPLLLSDDYGDSFVSEMTIEQLTEYINSTDPISTSVELNFARNQLKGKDKDLMQQFFYNFWLQRNAENPQKEWLDYKGRVKIANKEFSSSIKKGHETDRGRIFLKHGKPNSLSEHKNEPSAYPYEIWHYYKVDHFSNIKFVFYNPDGVSNDYPLLHSNLPGEINNLQWKVMLHQRTNQVRDPYQENNSEHWGGRSDEYFNNPR
jgi:GWxTD domain-containing protein